MSSRTRLSTDQKMRVLALLARGDTLSQVAGYVLETYQMPISESAISQIRSKNKDTVAAMQQTVADGQSAEADAIAARARRMLNTKLDKAERDSNELEDLDRQWRDSEIKDRKEYLRRKAGLMRISINELTSISKAMHGQTLPPPPINPDAPMLPAGTHSNSTPARLEAMLQAVAEGKTVTLQRLVFNPKEGVNG